MAASRARGYHVRLPTTWPGRAPTSCTGESTRPRKPRRASPPGFTMSRPKHSRNVTPQISP